MIIGERSKQTRRGFIALEQPINWRCPLNHLSNVTSDVCRQYPLFNGKLQMRIERMAIEIIQLKRDHIIEEREIRPNAGKLYIITPINNTPDCRLN